MNDTNTDQAEADSELEGSDAEAILTLAAPHSFSEEIKQSKFIANAGPVTDADDALSFIEHVSLADASHNCWAYRIGDQYRFFDDGEPASTAGKPIFHAIEGRGLDRVAVVVSRYFGGTKLGAGGLMRAYGGCAAKCLQDSQLHRIEPKVQLSFHIPFSESGLVYEIMSRFAVEKLNEEFDSQGSVITVEVLAREATAFRNQLIESTRGQTQFILED